MPKDAITRFQELGQMMVQLQKQIEAKGRENERLKTVLEESREKLARAEIHVQDLQQQLDVVKTLSLEHDEKSRNEFARKIQQYIKDIDEVIAHLNHT